MPELAEVAFYSNKWAPGLGDRVTEVVCRERARIYRTCGAEEIRRGLKGKALTGIETKGKQMRFVFEGASLGLHLGMTGKLLVMKGDHEAGRHDHLVIRQTKRSLVFRDARMFGALKFCAEAEPEWWTQLPPEVVSRGFTRKAVTDYLWRRKGSPLKAGTLDEEEAEVFWRETKQLCRDALRIIGTKYGRPPASWLFRHRWRRGGKCPRDGATLERAAIGGRTTAWCAECQRD